MSFRAFGDIPKTKTTANKRRRHIGNNRRKSPAALPAVCMRRAFESDTDEKSEACKPAVCMSGDLRLLKVGNPSYDNRFM
jgi:hypothetical protein